VTIYVDGAVAASTATNDGSYVGMEDTASLVWVGAAQSTAGAAENYWKDDMGAIFMTTDQLTAAQIHQLYLQVRGYMGQ
jgi:hypothetical protein